MKSLMVAVLAIDEDEMKSLQAIEDYLKHKGHRTMQIVGIPEARKVFTNPAVDVVLIVGRGEIWNNTFVDYLRMKPIVYLVTDRNFPPSQHYRDRKWLAVDSFQSTRLSQIEIDVFLVYMANFRELQELVKLMLN